MQLTCPTAFLQKLEYYPSLLFLTTNRPGVLDAALASRIHLTINYPPLDPESRLKIWRMFLTRAKIPAHITEEERRVLASIDLDGRRIKNVVKAAGIMATREGRGLEFDDVKKVVRITEGIIVQRGGGLVS
jgi:SpoVK/Ycf46/Vps4 family AAA+-type ATPase